MTDTEKDAEIARLLAALGKIATPAEYETTEMLAFFARSVLAYPRYATMPDFRRTRLDVLEREPSAPGACPDCGRDRSNREPHKPGCPRR